MKHADHSHESSDGPRTVQPGRRPRKRQQIVNDLRAMIVKGDLDPGGRLPSQNELQTRYGTGTVTVQNALGLLARDGFIETDGTRGTFVSRFPPHLTHYGVVFPESPRKPTATWSSFWAALDAQLPTLPTRDDRKLKTYYDAQEGTKGADYHRLISDLEHHRLAGLIFVTPPYPFMDTPVLEDHDVPKVAIMDRASFPDVPAVYFDFQSLLGDAVAYLAEQKRQRIAIIASGPMPPDLAESLPGLLRRHDMTTRPEWNHHLSPWIDMGVRRVVHLLMSCDNRPDGLIVLDDNLVPGVSDGLEDAGVSPADLTLVTHCNAPYPTRCDFPGKRLSFDTHEMLLTCLRLLQEQQVSKRVPSMTLLPVQEHLASH